VALIPTKYTNDRLTNYSGPYAFCVATEHHLIECGWHVDPKTGVETLIEKIFQVVSPYSTVLYREEEYWKYEAPETPPLSYEKNTYGRPYLPGKVTRGYTILETERAEFYPWTGFQSGSANLSSVREVSGYVIYDLHQARVGDNLTAEEQEKLQDEDRYPIGPPERIVDSARTVREAMDESGVIKKADASQTTVWVEPMVTRTEIVFEEVDKFLIYRTEHVHIRDGPPRHEGPEVKRKSTYRYKLPYPIEPPELAANADTDGIRLVASKGGVQLGPRYAHPTSYAFMRRLVVDGGRTASGDPFGRYQTPPAVDPPRQLVDVTTTDLAGAPASPLPGQTSYTEPGDSTDEAAQGWVVIARVDNDQPNDQPGLAEYLDTDLVNGSTYEYQATARINRDESPPSPPVSVAWGGSTSTSGIKVRVANEDGVVEIDVLSPDDPNLPGDDYGETVPYTVPLDVPLAEAEDLGEEIGRRNFLRNRAARLQLKVGVNVPLAILERGQMVRLPDIEWKVTGNQLQLDAQVVPDDWLLDGFRLKVTRNADGLAEFNATELDLVEP
jgi:hypothetical protein